MVDAETTPVAFLGVTETWWRGYMADAQLQISGYNLVRCDRKGRIGGGCALYIHSSLAISDQVEYSDNSNNLVAAYMGKTHSIVAVVYRAGAVSTDFEELVNKLQAFVELHSQDKTVPDVWVMGDFNLPLLKWKGGVREAVDLPLYNVLGQFVDNNSLSQMVSFPTRGENVLDLILTNRPEYVLSTKCEDLGISDHKMVTCTLTYNSTEKPTMDNRDRSDFAELNLLKADFDRLNNVFD